MVIAVRKDLNMRKGKIAAQSAHSAMKVWFDRMDKTEDGNYKTRDLTPEMIEWKENDFTKIVVGVNSEQDIYDLAEKAKAINIPYAIMIDNGFTEFAGRKTVTCIAIGPAKSDVLDPITGGLPLL